MAGIVDLGFAYPNHTNVMVFHTVQIIQMSKIVQNVLSTNVEMGLVYLIGKPVMELGTVLMDLMKNYLIVNKSKNDFSTKDNNFILHLLL